MIQDAPLIRQCCACRKLISGERGSETVREATAGELAEMRRMGNVSHGLCPECHSAALAEIQIRREAGR